MTNRDEDAIEIESWGDPGAAGEAGAGGVFEGANFSGERGGSGLDTGKARIFSGGFFDFGDKSGADHGGVGQAAQNGDMTRERDAEAYGDGELREGAGAAQERGEIVGQSVFGSGDAGAGDEIEES